MALLALLVHVQAGAAQTAKTTTTVADSQSATQNATHTAPSHRSAGLSVFWLSQPYTDADGKFGVFPLFIYKGPKAYMFGDYAGYNFYKADNFALGIYAEMAGYWLGKNDSSVLKDAGIDSRYPGLDAGICASVWDENLGVLQFMALGDAFLVNKSQSLKIQYSLPIYKESFALIPRVSASWKTAQFWDYYFGVGTKQVRHGLERYDADSGWVITACLEGLYFINSSLTLSSRVKCDFLPEQATDSPICDDDYALSVSAGLSYNF